MVIDGVTPELHHLPRRSERNGTDTAVVYFETRAEVGVGGGAAIWRTSLLNSDTVVVWVVGHETVSLVDADDHRSKC